MSFKKVTLKDEKILDRWSILIDAAQGRGGEVINKTMDYIKQSSPPGVNTEMVRVFTKGTTKFFSSFSKSAYEMGKDYLMVWREGSKVRMYIGAQDYGKNLYVSWYLALEPGFLDHLFSMFEKGNKWILEVKDIFTEEELNAYVTNVHHCLLKALEELMKELGQDPSKIDRKSKGFLGIS